MKGSGKRIETGMRRLNVYRFIKDFKKRHDGCSPSVKEIAEGMGMGETTVRYHIQVLIDLGLVAIFGGNSTTRNLMIVGGYLDDPNNHERQKIVAEYEKAIEESER